MKISIALSRDPDYWGEWDDLEQVQDVYAEALKAHVSRLYPDAEVAVCFGEQSGITLIEVPDNADEDLLRGEVDDCAQAFYGCGEWHAALPPARDRGRAIEMDLTREDRIMLGHLTTRDEAGRHFTEIYPDEWLARMEEAGYLTIERPVHAGTGMPYSPEHWRVEVSDEVAEWYDGQGRLIEDSDAAQEATP